MKREEMVKGAFLINVMKIGMSPITDSEELFENIPSVMVRFLRLHPSVRVHDLAN